MRYRTNQGLLIEAETSSDIVRRLRESSWTEQNLSDQAFMEAVADRMYQEGIHVSTISPDIFVAGLLRRRAAHARNGRLAVESGGRRSLGNRLDALLPVRANCSWSLLAPERVAPAGPIPQSFCLPTAFSTVNGRLS